jgi:putative acetyltransferase
MSIENARIRPITAADDAAMGAIAQASLAANGLDTPGTAYFDPELFHLSAFYGEKPDARGYYVAVDEAGAVLGGAGFSEFVGMENTAELQKLYLADSAKGHGLGTHFVHLVEDEARARGYAQLYLETHSNLQAAIHLYEKLGYRRIEKPASCAHATMDHFYLKQL